MVRGYVPGFVVGIVLSVVLFAISYGRVDLVHEVAFGDVYRSNVDSSRPERERLRARADEVQILRVNGHVFFGSTDRLLDRIRARADAGAPPHFLVIDLEHVTGVDASALAALAKAEGLASSAGTEITITGASDTVRRRLVRGGSGAARRRLVRARPGPGLASLRGGAPRRDGRPGRSHRELGRCAAGPFRYIERLPVAEGPCSSIRTIHPATSMCSRRAASPSRSAHLRASACACGPSVRGSWSARSRSIPERSAPPMSSPRPRAWCFDARARRSRVEQHDPVLAAELASLARRHAGRSAERHDAYIRRAPGLGEDLLTSRRAQGWPTAIAAGVIIGAVETVLAVAFAALVFGGLLWRNLPDGIGLYLAAAALTLGTLAWRAGRRGVVGSVQDAAAAVLAVAAGAAAARAKAIQEIADAAGLTNYKGPDVFLTVIAATLVVTVLCGVVFLVLGRGGWGNVIRFVPYRDRRLPGRNGLAPAHGWDLRRLQSAGRPRQDRRPGGHVPIGALAACLRVRRRAVAGGADRSQAHGDPGDDRHRLVGFVAITLATGSGLDEVRRGGWLLGPSRRPGCGSPGRCVRSAARIGRQSPHRGR